MNWQHYYIILIFASAVISIVIAIYAWQYRGRPGIKTFFGMMLSIAGYVLTSGMMSVSKTQEQALVWVNPHYFGLTMMLAFFISFTIQYTGRGKWLTKTWLAIIFSIPILTQIIIETNSLHHLFIQSISFSRSGILNGLNSIAYGGFFWFHSVYSYALVLTGVGFILQMSLRTFSLYRAQSLVLILGILPPLVASLNDSRLFFKSFEFPLVPIGFALMGVALFWAMFRYRMLDIVPVARETVLENMSDGMLVLDSHGNVVDINQSAQQLLGIKASQAIDQPAGQVIPPWSDLIDQYQKQAFAQSEITMNVSRQNWYFDVRISPLKTRRGHSNGYVVILRDITSRKRAENQVQETLAKVKALQEQLYEQAIHDPLTGLYNRHFFNETIPRELTRAERESYPVSFVLMDIDHFKAVNDTYGHQVGDLVLQHVASVLSKETRASDFVFRYGGDEFIVVLPTTHPQAAYQYAERWRASLQKSSIKHNASKILITMSIGIAAFSQDGKTPDEVLSAADDAMYRAKTSGRNCTVMFLSNP